MFLALKKGSEVAMKDGKSGRAGFYSAGDSVYKAMIERFRGLFFCADPRTFECFYINPAVKNFFGYERDEWLADPSLFPNSIHPDDRDRTLRNIERSLEQKKDGTMEFRIVTRDGLVRSVMAQYVFEKDEQGNVLNASGTLSDVTERKRMENKLILLQSISAMVVGARDITLALRYVLRKICEITDWALGEAYLPSADGSRLEHCASWSGRGEVAEKFIEASRKFTFTPGIGLPGRVWSSKEPIWISNVALDPNFPRSPYAIEAGLKGAVGIPVLWGDDLIAVLDFFIFEMREEEDEWLINLVSSVASQLGIFIVHKQTERELNERCTLSELVADIGVALTGRGPPGDILKECSEVFVKHLDVAFARIWTVNPRENILELQASAGMYTHIDGAHSRIPIGKCEVGLIASERRPHLTNDVTGDPHISDPEWARKEGMVAFAGYPLIVDDKTVGVIAMFARHRLTETVINAISSVADMIAMGIDRKGTEDELSKYRGHLEDLVKTRTRELEAARARADFASRAKSDFLANMSHELRTPLNSIIGFSDVLKDGSVGPINERQQEFMEDISSSGKYLLSLINDILDLSKIEVGKIELKTGEFDLKALLLDSIVFVKEEAARHNIRITADIQPAVGLINADELRVKQVVFNLLSNAVKFTPDGGAVGIEAGLQGNEIGVTVWDTGIGIEPQNIKRLFREFERLDSERTRRFGGTGLGLVISKKIVELHSGRIFAESEGVGRGSRFTFVIPVNRKQDADR